MKDGLLGYVGCPYCWKELTSHPFSRKDAPEAADREIREGILVCPDCRRWYPIVDFIPELLPDHLRDWARDRERLQAW